MIVRPIAASQGRRQWMILEGLYLEAESDFEFPVLIGWFLSVDDSGRALRVSRDTARSLLSYCASEQRAHAIGEWKQRGRQLRDPRWVDDMMEQLLDIERYARLREALINARENPADCDLESLQTNTIELINDLDSVLSRIEDLDGI